jgi:hypothetical protein
MLGSNNHPFWTEDTIAAAALTCVGTALLQSRLDLIAVQLNSPVLGAVARSWPLLLILSGVVLLIVEKTGKRSGRNAPQERGDRADEF